MLRARTLAAVKEGLCAPLLFMSALDYALVLSMSTLPIMLRYHFFTVLSIIGYRTFSISYPNIIGVEARYTLLNCSIFKIFFMVLLITFQIK